MACLIAFRWVNVPDFAGFRRVGWLPACMVADFASGSGIGIRLR